jgi:exonuclease SbcD
MNMSKLKVLHTGDLHFSNKADKLAETITVSGFILEQAAINPPDVAVIAGDLVDEHDSAIRIDSEAARAAISFVIALAEICPVLIIRGTRSHDRESPYLFAHLKSTFPIYVASKIEMVAFSPFPPGRVFTPLTDATDAHNVHLLGAQAVFTLIPSPDKANIIEAFGGDSKQSTTLVAKEALHDTLAYIGSVNDQVPPGIPKILVAHGMITGSQFSSGTIATGEDFEFGLSDLAQTNTDLKCFGHVHKQQSFPGNVHYAGSPGRMNMGEKEEKGFLVHSLGEEVSTTFVRTPARYFVFAEYDWRAGFHGDVNIAGKEGYVLAVGEAMTEVRTHPGCDARFRLTVPEEERHVPMSRQALEDKFLEAGARSAKIEFQVLPVFRQRAAGISHKETLAEKVIMYGKVNGIEISDRVLELAKVIEGMDVSELIEMAKQSAGEIEASDRKASTLAAGARFMEAQDKLAQETLF